MGGDEIAREREIGRRDSREAGLRGELRTLVESAVTRWRAVRAKYISGWYLLGLVLSGCGVSAEVAVLYRSR